MASDRVPPAYALEFGLALCRVVRAAGEHGQRATAVLALVGNLFYVVVYTGWLKRSTPQNIVIGGAAGAVPPLVGWAAATGSLAWPPWLFLIVFLWTPPHFWALALLIKRDYAAAKIPMLPVVRGDRETTRQIVLYSLVLVGFTAVPWHSAGSRPCTSRPRSSSAGCSCGWQSGYAAKRRRATRRCSSTTRSSIWPCSSWRWPWTRPSDGSRAGTKNARLGWLLFGLFRLLFAGIFVIAFLYLHFD